jgi:hypothetical protein
MGTIILNKKSFNLTIAQQTQCIKIIAEMVVNSGAITRFNLLVTCQESAPQSATILIPTVRCKIVENGSFINKFKYFEKNWIN